MDKKMILKIRLIITFQVLTLFSINIIEAQDFLDELPTSRRLNGKQTVKAFGIAGDNAKLSTITILSDKKAKIGRASCRERVCIYV